MQVSKKQHSSYENLAVNEIAILPKHIAIIMDGNGRWAKAKGKKRYAGHQAGVKTVKEVLHYCMQRNIKNLTLFAFSSENWNRPKTEVKLLMELLSNSLSSEREEFLKEDVKLNVIGDLGALPKRLAEKIQQLIDESSTRSRFTLNIAINYGGKWDIVQAAKQIAVKVQAGELDINSIDEDCFDREISLHGQDMPDLMIRTGGESRISNFLLWQLAYAELYFCDEYWPDFDEDAFDRALKWYASRQRRFGKTGEQIEAGQ